MKLIHFGAAFLLASLAMAGSETPPAGPPWTTDFGKALEQAAGAGKPVFVYFTKTY